MPERSSHATIHGHKRHFAIDLISFFFILYHHLNANVTTIKKHLRKDLELVADSQVHEHSPEFLAHLQKCINNNTHYLQSLSEWN